jgi:hypothetical protein
MAKHPAVQFIKYQIIREPMVTDEQINHTLTQWGMLGPADDFLPLLRASLPPLPTGFDPTNRLHRPSMQYLRDQGVYEFFFPTAAVEEAWDSLANPQKRMVVEQILLARLDLKLAAKKVNAKNDWHLTSDGMVMFRHMFWKVDALTFDEWGRYLYGRSALYDRYMGLLQASPGLAFFHLRLDQTLESKAMIRRTQEIAFFTLEEVAQRPGTGVDKVKAISMLGKTVVDCHIAMSTSDMALKEVLKEFERFRMVHPHQAPKDIKQLAPGGNFTGSGVDKIVVDGEKVPT